MSWKIQIPSFTISTNSLHPDLRKFRNSDPSVHRRTSQASLTNRHPCSHCSWSKEASPPLPPSLRGCVDPWGCLLRFPMKASPSRRRSKPRPCSTRPDVLGVATSPWRGGRACDMTQQSSHGPWKRPRKMFGPSCVVLDSVSRPKTPSQTLDLDLENGWGRFEG